MFLPTYFVREEKSPDFPALFNWNIYFQPTASSPEIKMASRISQFHSIQAAKAIAFDAGYSNMDCRILSFTRVGKQEIHVGG